MNDLIRPALYQSYHEIVPRHRKPMAATPDAKGRRRSDPVCESGDFFAQDRELPELKRRRSGRDHERGRLRIRDGVELQFAAVAGRSAGEGRPVCPDPRSGKAMKTWCGEKLNLPGCPNNCRISATDLHGSTQIKTAALPLLIRVHLCSSVAKARQKAPPPLADFRFQHK